MLKNVTLSAEEGLIEKARSKALRQNKTLNSAFREWLASYVGPGTSEERYRALMRQLRHVSAGRRFSREELNER
ncbi:MAG: hypothetical protein AB1705_17720 [Verrucomicrobiota bacterium]